MKHMDGLLAGDQRNYPTSCCGKADFIEDQPSVKISPCLGNALSCAVLIKGSGSRQFKVF